MPLATPLPQLQRELENLLLDIQYLATALQRLRDLLPEHSEKRVTVLTLLGRLNDANKKALRQVLDDHALQIEYNAIRSDLLDLIAALEPADFQENTKTETPQPNAAGKQGSVLYRIPHAMPLHKETECVVRIAVSEEAIVEEITIDKQVIVKGLSRISDLMQVELSDPARSPVFNIRSTSTPQQLITGEGYTQWFFYVEPLQEGMHALEVKVCVLEMALNQIARKELVFRETIEIYTEGKAGGKEPEASAPSFKKAGEALAFQGPGNTDAPSSKSATTVDPDFEAAIPDIPPAPPQTSAPQRDYQEPAEKTSGRGMRTVAFALAFLVLGSTATWALTPPATRDWWVASVQDSPEAYSHYIKEYPTSAYAEKAFYYKATRTRQLADWRAYKTRYPDGAFSRQVASQLNTLEINEIDSIKMRPTVENIQRFASDFPNSERLHELKAAAETSPDRREQLMAAVEDAYVTSAQRKPTAQKIENYLHDFPNASRLDEVHAAAASNPQVFARVQPQLEDAFLKKMETNPTRAEAEDFLNKFPEPVQKEKFEKILDKKPAVKQPVIRKMRKIEAARDARELKNTADKKAGQ